MDAPEAGKPGFDAGQGGAGSSDAAPVDAQPTSEAGQTGDAGTSLHVMRYWELVSRDNLAGFTDKPSSLLQVTSDARYVLFANDSSDPNLPSNPDHLYVLDYMTSRTEAVRLTPDGVTPPTSWDWVSISDDFSTVVYSTATDGIMSDDQNGLRDIFVRGPILGMLQLVRIPSQTPGNGAPANQTVFGVSGDGNTVLFRVGDDYGAWFLWDHQSNMVRRCDKTVDGSPHGGIATASLSHNGKWVSFPNGLRGVGEADTGSAAYVYDAWNDVTTVVPDGIQGSISDDGRFLFNGAIFYDREASRRTQVRAASSIGPAMSNDGKLLLALAAVSHFPQGSPLRDQIFDVVVDQDAQKQAWINFDRFFNRVDAQQVALSGDGKYVVIQTDAPLSDGDDNGVSDIYRSGVDWIDADPWP